MDQIDDIKNIKLFRSKLDGFIKNKIDITKSAPSYGCSWEKNYPTFYLKNTYNKNYVLKLIFFYFLDIFKSTYNNFHISKTSLKKKSYNKLIITWGSLKNYRNNIYYDQFYKKNSKNKKILWIIFLLEVPKKLPTNENIIFFYNKKSSFNLKNLILIIKNSLIENGFYIKKYFHYLSPYTETAKKFSQLTIPILKNIKFKEVEIVYEGQPFQNYFIKNFRKISKAKIKGLCHAYQALPMHLIKKKFEKCDPDQIIVHQIDQKKSLIKYLYWDKNEVTYQKRVTNEKFQNCIYLPFSIENYSKYVTEFKKFLKSFKLNFKEYYFPSIKIHPAKNKNKSYINFKNSINRELQLYFNYFKTDKVKNKKNFILFFGPSSGVIRATNKGNNVFQIFINKYTDTFRNIFWSNFKKSYITSNSILYVKNRK